MSAHLRYLDPWLYIKIDTGFVFMVIQALLALCRSLPLYLPTEQLNEEKWNPHRNNEAYEKEG